MSQQEICPKIHYLFHKKIKHIDIQYHYVCECHTNGLINIQHISTNQQLADSLIKAVTTRVDGRCDDTDGVSMRCHRRC